MKTFTLQLQMTGIEETDLHKPLEVRVGNRSYNWNITPEQLDTAGQSRVEHAPLENPMLVALRQLIHSCRDSTGTCFLCLAKQHEEHASDCPLLDAQTAIMLQYGALHS